MTDMVKIYIDGQEGTTGLKILERFENRSDIELIKISEEKRKDAAERARLINSSDFTFLCLPDAAAREAVSLVTNPTVRVIDASTAHRTLPDWDYGFPELSAKHRENIVKSKRVAVPGCYAAGFASVVYPLVHSGLIPADYPVFAYGVSGYSGAGKKAIAIYESDEKTDGMYSPRLYSLGTQHKHIPEMQKISGLEYPPMFSPVIDDYYSGMVVSVPVQTRLLPQRRTRADFLEALCAHYAGSRFITVSGEAPDDGFISSNKLAGTNKMEIFVLGNDEQVMLCSRLDNLGKGASGAAVQCLNIMMGIDETEGLL